MSEQRPSRVVRLLIAVGFLGACASAAWLLVVGSWVIPTGTMAPTLLGDHFEAKCSTCRYAFPVSKREGDLGPSGEEVEARCPLCGADTTATFKAGDVHSGARIIANKLARRPSRWDVIVFRYPLDPSKSFVKRVVGMPGETLRIDAHGDLWVKSPGTTKLALERKPRDVQEALWLPVWDARYPDPRTPGWKPDQAGRWDVKSLTAKPGAGETWLMFTKQPRDDFGYNPEGRGSQGRHEVADLRVRARVTPAADAKSVRLALVENDRQITADFAVGSGDVALLVSGSAVATAKGKALARSEEAAISLAYADERASVTVNGEVVLEWEDSKPFGLTESSGALLGCVGPGGASFADVKIDRDIFWTSIGEHDPSREDVAVPADAYFVLGDNSPNSMDSRVYGAIPSSCILGRVIFDLTSFRGVR